MSRSSWIRWQSGLIESKILTFKEKEVEYKKRSKYSDDFRPTDFKLDSVKKLCILSNTYAAESHDTMGRFNKI